MDRSEIGIWLATTAGTPACTMRSAIGISGSMSLPTLAVSQAERMTSRVDLDDRTLCTCPALRCCEVLVRCFANTSALGAPCPMKWTTWGSNACTSAPTLAVSDASHSLNSIFLAPA